MVTIRIRYMVPRKQKGHTSYYWLPIKKYHPHFVTIPLGRDRDKAVIKAQRYNAELDEFIKTGVKKNHVQKGTVAWLVDKYLGSTWYAALAPRTKKDYLYWLEDIKKFAGNESIEFMTRKVCKSYYTKKCETSTHKGNAAMRVLKLLFSFAIDDVLIDGNDNPAKGIRLVGTNVRHQVWTYEECEKYIEAAIKEGRRSIAVAMVIAENLGQREGDILKMRRDQYDGESITVKQGKTGAFIKVKCTEQLKFWLDGSDSEYLVVNEETGKPYKSDNFRHWFAHIKKDLDMKDKLFMDLRRTAIVRLGEAGCEIQEIAAVSGHSIETCRKILEVYLPRNATMASNAITKLENYRAEKLKEKLKGQN